jgi:hypothetical protein
MGRKRNDPEDKRARGKRKKQKKRKSEAKTPSEGTEAQAKPAGAYPENFKPKAKPRPVREEDDRGAAAHSGARSPVL